MAFPDAIGAIGSKQSGGAEELRRKQMEQFQPQQGGEKTAFYSMPPIFGNPAAQSGACGVQA